MIFAKISIVGCLSTIQKSGFQIRAVLLTESSEMNRSYSARILLTTKESFHKQIIQDNTRNKIPHIVSRIICPDIS